MTELRLAYITAQDRTQALTIGRALVERRLAACVNILDGMTSIYHWQGAIEEASEAVLLAKTDVDRVEGLIATVRELHAYSVPCVIVMPVVDGNPDYLKWLASNLR